MSVFDSLAFDPLALFWGGCRLAEEGAGQSDAVGAFVFAPMIKKLDEGLDLAIKVAGQGVVS